MDNSGQQLKQLLHNKQNQHRSQRRIFHRQAKRHGKLGHFVRQRIQNFTQSGDHIAVPGNLTVHGIGQAGHSQDSPGGIVLAGGFRPEIGGHIHRDQRQPEQTQQIGDRKDFFFPVAYKHGHFLRRQTHTFCHNEAIIIPILCLIPGKTVEPAKFYCPLTERFAARGYCRARCFQVCLSRCPVMGSPESCWKEERESAVASSRRPLLPGIPML